MEDRPSSWLIEICFTGSTYSRSSPLPRTVTSVKYGGDCPGGHGLRGGVTGSAAVEKTASLLKAGTTWTKTPALSVSRSPPLWGTVTLLALAISVSSTELMSELRVAR